MPSRQGSIHPDLVRSLSQRLRHQVAVEASELAEEIHERALKEHSQRRTMWMAAVAVGFGTAIIPEIADMAIAGVWSHVC